MAKPKELHQGFLLQIEPRPGLTLAQARELERHLEDYAEAHELDLGGHHRHRSVQASDRSLSITDQVDLIDWLVDQPGVSVVRISCLSARLDEAEAVWQGGSVQASICDVGLIGLAILYRARRIRADQYLQILGGFMRPAALQ
jgi:hypothetical protein